MGIVDSTRRVIGGVDTHLDTHMAAVVDSKRTSATSHCTINRVTADPNGAGSCSPHRVGGACDLTGGMCTYTLRVGPDTPGLFEGGHNEIGSTVRTPLGALARAAATIGDVGGRVCTARDLGIVETATVVAGMARSPM